MIVLIGGSGGIGQKLIETHTSSEKVIVTYNSNQITTNNPNVTSYKLNLENDKEIEKFSSYVKELKPLELTIIYLATLSIDNLLLKTEISEWEKVFSINTKGAFLTAKYFIPLMMENQWGRFIFTSSIVSEQSQVGTVSYSSSKCALNGISRSICKEYSRFGITSNIIQLGYFNTGLINKLSPEKRKEILRLIPSKTLGTTDNIHNCIQFIQKSPYVNGSTIKIDGGM
jgi:NAD(P)-dependent dehydrogenase (short-subunit alcohol dehydrogenase family)